MLDPTSISESGTKRNGFDMASRMVNTIRPFSKTKPKKLGLKMKDIVITVLIRFVNMNLNYNVCGWCWYTSSEHISYEINLSDGDDANYLYSYEL